MSLDGSDLALSILPDAPRLAGPGGTVFLIRTASSADDLYRLLYAEGNPAIRVMSLRDSTASGPNGTAMHLNDTPASGLIDQPAIAPPSASIRWYRRYSAFKVSR